MLQKLFYFALLTLLLVACGGTETSQPTDPSPSDTPPTDTDTTPPSPPLWVTMTPGDGQVALRWQANSETDLDHYVLYWGTQSGVLNDSEEIAGTLTEHAVTGLTNGTPYFFVLTAVDAAGNVSLKSTEVMATPEALPEPPAPPPPAESDFSISTLESLSIQKGQGKSLPFNIARNNFADEITVTLKDAPDGVSSDLPLGTTGDELVTTITVDNSAAISAGDYTLEFEATSGGLSKTLEVTLTVTEPLVPPPAPEVPPAPEIPVAQPEITSVSLEGFGASKQVRQGYGNVTLNVVGNHLGSISEAKLEASDDGGLVVGSIPVSILNKTDTAITLQATVQHGAVIASYTLALSNGSTIQKSFGFMVTPIVVGPTGNDGTGKGTPEAPFRSLTKAVSVANHQDFIVLGAGEYNITNGEDFPIDVSGMTIIGTHSEDTVIVGTGSVRSCLGVTSGEADTTLVSFHPISMESSLKVNPKWFLVVKALLLFPTIA